MNEYTGVTLGGVTATRTYDANGNLTFDGVKSFFFDAFNRLVKVEVGGVSIAVYAYDHRGRRIRRSVKDGVNDEDIAYYYLGGTVVEEVDALTASVERQYVWGPGGLLQYKNSGFFPGVPLYVHENGYGSVMATTDEGLALEGGIYDRFDYDAFGMSVRTGGIFDTGLPYRFRGWRLDAETSFYSLAGGHYYQASLGRRICRGGGALLNLYAYMGNNLIPYYPEIYTTGWPHDFVKWIFDDPDDDPKPKKRDRPVDPSKPIGSYNCGGLAFRDYVNYDTWAKFARKINGACRKDTGTTDCATLQCKAGELKVYVWQFYRQTRRGSPDNPGEVVDEPELDFHAVAGKVTTTGVEPTGVVSKNGPGPIESSDTMKGSDYAPKPQPTAEPGSFQEFVDEHGNPRAPKLRCFCCRDPNP